MLLCPLERTHTKCHTVKSLEHSSQMVFVIFWNALAFVQGYLWFGRLGSQQSAKDITTFLPQFVIFHLGQFKN